MSERVRVSFCFLVGAGWLANLVAGIVDKSYTPNLTIGAPMLLVLGAVFSTRKSDK